MTKVANKQLTKGLLKSLRPKQIRNVTEPSIIKLKVCHVSSKGADGSSSELSDHASRVFGNYGISLGNKFHGTSYISFDSVIFAQAPQSIKLICDFINMSKKKNTIIQLNCVFLTKKNEYKIIKSGIVSVSDQKRCTIDLSIDDIALSRPFCSTLHLSTNNKLILQSAFLNVEIRK